jgi:two-component system response regulator (stage 0 sporulation protein A)
MPERRTSVLVVDDNIDLADMLSEFISDQPDMEVVGAAYNGIAAIDLIDDTRPDVVVLDLIMPRLDGLGVIEHVRQMPAEKRPRIIVASAISTDTTAASMISAGADYYIAKPFDLSVMVDRIRRMSQSPPGSRFHRSDVSAYDRDRDRDGDGDSDRDRDRDREGAPEPYGGGGGDGERDRGRDRDRSHSDGSASRAPIPEVAVSRALCELGVPANLKGYEYLRDAVIMAMEQGHVMGSVTTVVYPQIARMRDTTPSRVERAIRHAIETAWIRGDINVLNDVFGHTVDAEKGRPTNSAFIARVADKIRIEMKSR